MRCIKKSKQPKFCLAKTMNFIPDYQNGPSLNFSNRNIDIVQGNSKFFKPKRDRRIVECIGAYCSKDIKLFKKKNHSKNPKITVLLATRAGNLTLTPSFSDTMKHCLIVKTLCLIR